jgi:hypothetical protein
MAAKRNGKKTRAVPKLKESAHEIYLAGLGAFALAGEEGGRLFRQQGPDSEARQSGREPPGRCPDCCGETRHPDRGRDDQCDASAWRPNAQGDRHADQAGGGADPGRGEVEEQSPEDRASGDEGGAGSGLNEA